MTPDTIYQLRKNANEIQVFLNTSQLYTIEVIQARNRLGHLIGLLYEKEKEVVLNKIITIPSKEKFSLYKTWNFWFLHVQELLQQAGEVTLTPAIIGLGKIYGVIMNFQQAALVDHLEDEFEELKSINLMSKSMRG